MTPKIDTVNWKEYIYLEIVRWELFVCYFWAFNYSIVESNYVEWIRNRHLFRSFPRRKHNRSRALSLSKQTMCAYGAHLIYQSTARWKSTESRLNSKEFEIRKFVFLYSWHWIVCIGSGVCNWMLTWLAVLQVQYLMFDVWQRRRATVILNACTRTHTLNSQRSVCKHCALSRSKIPHTTSIAYIEEKWMNSFDTSYRFVW